MTAPSDRKADSDTALALMQAQLDKSLAKLTAASDESLARLKVALDAGQSANRELFGTATIYFYALRSIALGKWDEDSLKAAEMSMISATRQLIHLEDEMRNEWFDFWQRAQEIHRTASKEPDVEARPKLVSTLVGERIQTSSGRLDFRELHSRLERAARLAIEAPQLDKSRASV